MSKLTILLTVPAEWENDIKNFCREHNLPVSAYVRKLISKHLKLVDTTGRIGRPRGPKNYR